MVFWNKKFERPEHKLDFTAQYSQGESTESGDYLENIYSPTDLSLFTPNSLTQYVRTIDGNAITTIQLDYYRPLSFTKTLLMESLLKIRASLKQVQKQPSDK
ncbi:MAG: outer membrane beta-barrel protein [Crocinitomicaceae bacterium]|nr:outer membrane beta-barrel protein [Crocinitomicaceae bacterium]